MVGQGAIATSCDSEQDMCYVGGENDNPLYYLNRNKILKFVATHSNFEGMFSWKNLMFIFFKNPCNLSKFPISRR